MPLSIHAHGERTMRHWLSALAVPSIASIVTVQGISATTTEVEAGCGTPRDLQDGWSIEVPQQQGFDPASKRMIAPEIELLDQHILPAIAER
jgi:hypothetical protein